MGVVSRLYSGYDLQKEFMSYGRDYYSPAAYEVMYDYLNDFGDDIDVDVIALCGDFTETDNPWTLIREYDLDLWLDEIDLTDYVLTAKEWIDGVEDKDEFFELLPDDCWTYENDKYILTDPNRKVTLGELDHQDYVIRDEMQYWDDFQKIVSEHVSNADLFEILAEELSEYTMCWDLHDSILFLAY